jgi:glycosyltransferase involved in cell wall biosynthesis
MCPVSVVIITRNEADIIGKTLQTISGFTDDLVIVDSGSTDETLSIAASFNCHIIETNWQGYGPTKNIGIDAAKYDWILSLDADEIPDQKLLTEIRSIDFSAVGKAYDLDFKTYFGEKQIRFGEWGIDHHVRLVNRNRIRWSDDEVHEEWLMPNDVTVEKLKGAVHHYTIKNAVDLKKKFIGYAELNAIRYHGNNRSSSFRLWGSPAFSFLQNYFLKLGFLDGYEGFTIAKLSAYYTWLKYYRLKQLNKNK